MQSNYKMTSVNCTDMNIMLLLAKIWCVGTHSNVCVWGLSEGCTARGDNPEITICERKDPSIILADLTQTKLLTNKKSFLGIRLLTPSRKRILSGSVYLDRFGCSSVLCLITRSTTKHRQHGHIHRCRSEPTHFFCRLLGSQYGRRFLRPNA